VSVLEVFLVLEGALGVLQHLVVGSFTTTGGADQHETVTHLASIVKLDNLVQEHLLRLHVVLHAGSLKLNHQLAVVDVRLINTREKILNDVLEQRQVIL
jgi:hypothetical protein